MSWLKKYLDFTENHEAPELFHLWTGVTILSAALGRKVFLDRGYYILYPNFFTVLVAGSARCRKSTCISIGMKVLEESLGSNVEIIEGKSSPEKMLEDMAYELYPKEAPIPSHVIYADELADFLTRDHQGDKMIETLNKLFDCPDKYTYKTKGGGVQIVRDVYITVIAGTTPDKLSKCMPDTAVGGGFFSRLILPFQEDTTRSNAFPKLSEAEIKIREELVKDLKRIFLLKGTFTIDKNAEDYAKEWYKTLRGNEDTRIDGFIGRKLDHVLRVAMILAAQTLQTRIVIGDIQAAIMMIDQIQELLPQAMEHVGSSDNKTQVERCIRILRTFKRISHSDMLVKCYSYMDATQVGVVMGTLISMGWVKRDEARPHIYVWNDEEEKSKK